jgi:hypothetical protein
VAIRHYRFVAILLVYGARGTVLYHRPQKEGNVTQTQSKLDDPTLLSGPVVDQAALHSVLKNVRDYSMAPQFHAGLFTTLSSIIQDKD